jgi:hypothetical protein
MKPQHFDQDSEEIEDSKEETKFPKGSNSKLSLFKVPSQD